MNMFNSCGLFAQSSRVPCKRTLHNSITPDSLDCNLHGEIVGLHSQLGGYFYLGLQSAETEPLEHKREIVAEKVKLCLFRFSNVPSIGLVLDCSNAQPKSRPGYVNCTSGKSSYFKMLGNMDAVIVTHSAVRKGRCDA
jgi:hypothetical protein